METINIILDSHSEHKQCRLTSKYLKWKKIKLQPVFRKLLYIFPTYKIEYKTLADLDHISKWIYPLELAYLENIVDIKDFIKLLPSKVLQGKGVILFMLRENLPDRDIVKIQESIVDRDIAKRVVFLSVHKDNNRNFKHFNVCPQHFHNFSVDNRSIELSNDSCDFVDKYDKRRFCCFLQHYSESPERKYLLSFLEKHSLLDKGFISAKNNAKDFNTIGKGGYSFTSYDSVFNDLDIATTINNSYINIIPEGNFTHRESQFVTEKPLRSFFYKKPFIMMNRQYDLRYIRSMGYKTFSPIIDESYDNIYNHSSRMAAICTEIKRLMNKPFTEFKKDIKQLEDICDHNYMIYQTQREKLEKYLYDKTTKNY